MRAICWTVLCAFLFVPCRADIDVTFSGPGGVIEELQEVSGEWRVIVQATSSAAPLFVTITGDTTDNVLYIIVRANNTGQHVRLTLAGESGVYDIPSIGSVVTDGASVGTVIVDDIRVGGDVGSIDVHQIIAGRIQGDVTGEIIVDGGGIQNNLVQLQVDGDVLGDVYVGLNIQDFKVIGRLGTSATPVTVQAVGGYIRFLEAGSIHADISTHADSFVQYIGTTGAGGLDGDFAGSLSTDYMNCNACGDARRGILIADDLAAAITVTDYQREDIVVADDFTGSLTITNSSEEPITIDGDMDGDIVIGGSLLDPVTIGTIKSGRTLRIGGTLNGSGDILIDASGLTGQIVVNAANSSGTWSGDVTVGSTTLATTPYYSNLPSALGGGAVGLVPYRVHGAASVPASGSTVLTDPASVTIEYYGRLINLATGSETPMAIRKRAIASNPPGSWTTVTTNYDYAVSGRTVTITPKSGHSFDGWFEWEITPVAGELKCANAA